MAWKIEQSETGQLVTVAASGEIDTPEALEQIKVGIELIRSMNARGALVDYSDATLRMEIHELFKLPDLFDALGLSRSVRIAILLPADPKNMHKYTFFDDVATNRGFQVKLFWEHTAAHVWLTQTPASKPPATSAGS